MPRLKRNHVTDSGLQREHQLSSQVPLKITRCSRTMDQSGCLLLFEKASSYSEGEPWLRNRGTNLWLITRPDEMRFLNRLACNWPRERKRDSRETRLRQESVLFLPVSFDERG